MKTLMLLVPLFFVVTLFSADPGRAAKAEDAPRLWGTDLPACVSLGTPHAIIRGPHNGWPFFIYYSNTVDPEAWTTLVREVAGWSWFPNVPLLHQKPDQRLFVETGAWHGCSFEYRPAESLWQATNGETASITRIADPVRPLYVLAWHGESELRFHAAPALVGKIAELSVADGRRLSFYHYDGGCGRYAHKLKAIYDRRDAWFWQFFYFSDNGLMKEIRTCRGSSLRSVMSFAYYDELLDGVGGPEDLKSVTLRTREGDDKPWSERTTWLRYYTAVGEFGRPHDLKYIIGPEEQQKIASLHGAGDLAGLSDRQIHAESPGRPVRLFDYYFEYYPSGQAERKPERVRRAIVGRESTDYTYALEPRAGVYEFSWAAPQWEDLDGTGAPYVTVRLTRPDGVTIEAVLTTRGSPCAEQESRKVEAKGRE